VVILKKYNLSGAEVGSVQVDDLLVDLSAHSQMVKDYIIAIRTNARQWSANTKGRKEINRSGKKPHAQKGQGRSRKGCVAAPQYKGGGIVFGPKPKFDQHVRINKKERRAAIRCLLAEKIKANQVHILQAEPMAVPRTQIVSGFLKSLDLHDSRVLFLGESNIDRSFFLSMRNLPKIESANLLNINGYNLALCRSLVVLEPVFDQFLAILG